MSKVKGVCIKSYEDEEDVSNYEDGMIKLEEVMVYEVGDEEIITDGFYNKEYWKIKD